MSRTFYIINTWSMTNKYSQIQIINQQKLYSYCSGIILSWFIKRQGYWKNALMKSIITYWKIIRIFKLSCQSQSRRWMRSHIGRKKKVWVFILEISHFSTNKWIFTQFTFFFLFFVYILSIFLFLLIKLKKISNKKNILINSSLSLNRGIHKTHLGVP